MPKIHGERAARTRTYVSWANMRQRCANDNRPDWEDYGGRGIKVCERWATYPQFKEDMGVRPHGKTLDRKDPNGNYEPNNCRWATRSQQENNKRFRNGRAA